RFNRAPRLILQDDRTVALLKEPQALFRRPQIGLGPRELLRQESALIPGVAGAELADGAIEQGNVLVGDLRCLSGIAVFHLDRDDALSRECDGRAPLEGADGVFDVPGSITLLQTEALHERLRHRAALQDAQDEVAVRSQ